MMSTNSVASPTASSVPRRKRRWILRIFVVLLALVLVASASGLWYVNSVLNASLPVYSGNYQVAGVQKTLRIERDAQGVPTLHGSSFPDLAFGLGVVHAQERFFQMDLLRRKAAGELSALVGAAALPVDKQSRVHRFRSRMRAIWEKMSAEEQEPIKRYCQGVAWGLEHGFAGKGAKPFEYHLLRCELTPWQPEDCLLCVCAMYLELQSDQITVEMIRANLYAAFTPEVARFFDPDGTPWDAAIDGSKVPIASLPTAEQLPLHNDPALKSMAGFEMPKPLSDKPMLGSNNWAVSGKKTKHGGALIADDMHLGISMPNIWYRACLKWTDADGTPRQACGVTLPGGPAIVAGSNGYVAWAFTNTEGDWLDLLAIESDAINNKRYKTLTGVANYVVHEEMIEVKGEKPQPFTVVETIWGPVVAQDRRQTSYALRWVAHDPDGVNMKTTQMLKARTVEEAMNVAASCGIPHQNYVCGDRSGRIAWTIAGRIPKRSAPQRAATPALKQNPWQGFLTAEEYPRVVEPEQGRIWTANNRVVGGEMFAKLGNGGVDSGLRAGQIRDRLMAVEQADEKNMLAIQLDDEARSLQKWKALFLETVPAEEKDNPRRSALRRLVLSWDGYARSNSVGYLILEQFRSEVASLVYKPVQAMVAQKGAFPDVNIIRLQQMEGPLWAMLTQKPQHLLNPRYETWQAQLLDAIGRVSERMQNTGKPFEEQTWGEANATRVRHPLSAAIPMFSKWLDVPDSPLPGARRDMPRISSPGHGASERFAVSPGKEEQGIFHMPGGQSGHPLSPHYKDGHAAWEQGLATPFLPGAKVSEMVFERAK